MMKISSIFINNSEDYVTIPAIRKFIDENPELNIKYLDKKDELWEALKTFGEKSKENENKVLDWLDSVCREGIKDIYLSCQSLSDFSSLQISDDEKINMFLKKSIHKDFEPHICSNIYEKDFILINAFSEESTLGKRLVFMYCKRLTVYDKKEMRRKDVDFPVIAEYYIENSWLLIKVKPRSNIYQYTGKDFNIDTDISTTLEKQVK